MVGEIVFAAFAMPNLSVWLERLSLTVEALASASGVPLDVIRETLGGGNPEAPDGARLPYSVARRLFDALRVAYTELGRTDPLFVRDLITSNRDAGDLRVPRVPTRNSTDTTCILPRELIVPAPEDGHPWARGTKVEEPGWIPPRP